MGKLMQALRAVCITARPVIPKSVLVRRTQVPLELRMKRMTFLHTTQLSKIPAMQYCVPIGRWRNVA